MLFELWVVSETDIIPEHRRFDGFPDVDGDDLFARLLEDLLDSRIAGDDIVEGRELRHDILQPRVIIPEVRNRSDDDFRYIDQLLLAAMDHLSPLVVGERILCREFLIGWSDADEDVRDPLFIRLFDAIKMSAMQPRLAAGDEESCLGFHGL